MHICQNHNKRTLEYGLDEKVDFHLQNLFIFFIVVAVAAAAPLQYYGYCCEKKILYFICTCSILSYTRINVRF